MYLRAIGQKRSSVARIKKILTERNCMNYTIMLLLQLLIQQHYSLLHLIVADAMGEYFMNKGLRVLVFTMILVNML